MRWRLLVLGALVIGGCSAAPHANSADTAFLQQMIPHHERAIEVAGLAASRAGDARVREFGARIVREQSPELARMKSAAAHLHPDYAAGSRAAQHRITDAQVATLRTLSGAAFDRMFVSLNIASEQGAVDMAKTELGAGKDSAARAVAKGIAGAPVEIAQLQELLASLG